MANWDEWKKANFHAGFTSEPIELHKSLKTTETYSRISQLGLDTVIFEEIIPTEGIDNKIDIFDRAGKFIEKNRPCLFIYDPSNPNKPELKKGYLFGIIDNVLIMKWLTENEKDILNHTYLMTTQIINHGNGYVGSVFSDGTGNMFCETLHKPGVSNHRELSQPKDNFSQYLDYFLMEEFEIRFKSKMSHLRTEDISNIKNTFEHLNGYFEFVYGKMNGKLGIYTTGFEKISTQGLIKYPHSFHETMPFDTKSRVISNSLGNN